MFERFTDGARQVVVRAQEDARRLGHNYIGCEHLLLAATETGEPAGVVLRDQGVTPERVEAEILRTIGRGSAGADPLRGLDREALAAIGIDLDVVRARIEAAFGPDALDRAVLAHRRAADGGGRPAWRKGPVAELMRRRRRRPAAARSWPPLAGQGTRGSRARLPGVTSRSRRAPRRAWSCPCGRPGRCTTTTSACSTWS